MGRGRGGRSSGSRTNNFDVSYIFDIYTLQQDGQTPTTFEGAIENFEGTFNDTDSNEFALSDEIEVSGLTLGLTPRFLDENIQFTLFDGTPITASIDDGNIPFSNGVATTDVARIEYKIGNEFSNENGELSEFVLFIEDEDGDISNGFQAGGIEIDVDRATNDIDYIVTEDLFSLITSVRVSGQDINDPNRIVSTENEARELMFETFPPVAVNDSASTEINTAITIDVLANDNVGFLDSFDISSSQGGTVTLNDGGTLNNPIDDQLEYTPAADFVGIDSFEYTTTNGNETSTAATVTIEVSEPVVEEPVVEEPVTEEPVVEEPVVEEPVVEEPVISAVGDTVFRFFNPNVGVHFYTADQNESDFVRDNLDVYNFEGESYKTVDPLTLGAEDVYRFFNSRTGVHLYTTDEVERDFILENLNEFSFEGTAFNAYENNVEGSIPIYRFFEPSLGVHFYTPNEAEKDFVDNNLDNYDFEGIAYYAFPL